MLNTNGIADSKNTVNQNDPEPAQFEFELVAGGLDGIGDNTRAWVRDFILLAAPRQAISVCSADTESSPRVLFDNLSNRVLECRSSPDYDQHQHTWLDRFDWTQHSFGY